jgi:hypothetical protein
LRIDLDFIALYLLQVQLSAANHMLMNNPAVLARTPPPLLHRFLVDVIRNHNRLYRISMGQQGDGLHHRFGIGPQAIEDRPFGSRKGVLAFMANVTFFDFAMTSDVPLSGLCSCRAVQIRAKNVL